jgi:geranylgeranyl diphosphate synthase type II
MSELATLHPVATLDARLGEVIANARHRPAPAAPEFARLWDEIERMAAGGKRIRPRLLLDAHAALGGQDDRAAMDAACALELLHLALVIHDDVIDHDLTRRGELNVTGAFAADAEQRGAAIPNARAWGEASSILAGDLLLTTAHSLIARLDVDAERCGAVLDAFEDAVHRSAAGEHRDVWLSLHLEDARPQDVLGMIEQKTAAYSFQAPLVIAAVLTGAPASVIDELTGIARRIGVIYQLRDDVLGVFGDETRTGKSALSDLREGKETLLVAYARSNPAWAGVATLFGDARLGETDGDRVRRVIRDSTALALVEAVIAEHCAEAERMIAASDLPPALRTQLEALVSQCSERES